MADLSSAVPDLSAMPLGELPAAVLEPMVQRVLPGPPLAPSQDVGFSSHI